jgi:hypothetical protein
MAPSVPTQVPPQTETTEISPNGFASDNPAGAGAGAVRGGANMYGGFSMEKFCNVGGLSYTHEDAGGFLDYVKQFTPLNFWYKDAGVQIWAYYETYDNWQDTYGMDAVCAVYHSGHGGMDGNGVFYAPMGSAWAGNDCTAISSNMRLGNEHVKYIFWSTCLSCRVLGGQNPIRTWQAANLGFRMLFGFETVSWDNPDYGKNFWQEWNKGKSFSTAWLDASWRIAHDQAPSVVACGATAAEAQNRLFNERLFYCSPVSHDYWWWRWYYAATATRQPLLTVPSNLLVARLRPVDLQAASAQALAERFEVDLPGGETARAADGSFRAAAGDKLIAVGADGSVDVQLAKPNLDNRQQIEQSQASSIAQAAVDRFGLGETATLVPDRVLLAYEAGGTESGSGELQGPHVTGTVVQFRQTVNGIPILGNDAGVVRVSIDNDGTVTNVHSSVRAVDSLSERGGARQSAPTPPGGAQAEPSPEPADYQDALAVSFGENLTRWAASGAMPIAFTTVAESTEIGYEFRGDEAVVVARQAIEVDFGRGYRKRYWVTAPIS